MSILVLSVSHSHIFFSWPTCRIFIFVIVFVFFGAFGFFSFFFFFLVYHERVVGWLDIAKLSSAAGGDSSPRLSDLRIYVRSRGTGQLYVVYTISQ